MYLTAAEAILPALQRTRRFLFQPFRFGTYLKLCLVALLTEGLGGNNHFSNVTSHHAPHHAGEFQPPFHFDPHWIPALIAIALVMLAFGLLVAYLITRLRFAYFYSLIHNIREIRPGWHLYRSQAVRFFWLNIVVGFCFLLAVAILALPFISVFLRIWHETQAGAQPGIGEILALVLPIIPILLLLVIAGFVTDMILRDFMLPHFALEDATSAQAWASVWARIRTQKGPFFVYTLLRIVLPIIGAIVLFAILIVPAIAFVAGVAIIEVGLHSAFGGDAIAAQILVGIVSFAIAALVGICFGGPLSTATREFALIFYGGRYQPLGDILFPPPPASA
jgi:MFS family permease